MEFVPYKKRNGKEGLHMMTDEKIKTSDELEFAVFCIENVARKLGVDAKLVYQLIRDGVSDMHCMSDEYLAEELGLEYVEKMENC